MKVYYDLHIHSGLSPCGSEDMSPNNILNMSLIKGLDVIAVTDHNSIENVEVVYDLSKNMDLMVIPGMEIQTQEDIHSIVLFETVEALKIFYNKMLPYQLKLPNKPEKFGHQHIYNAEDEVVGEVAHYLIVPFSINLEDMVQIVNDMEGVVFPAHVNRNSFSIINNIGFIPENLQVNNLEWYKTPELDMNAYKNRMFKAYRPLFNSDAHDLIQISERENFLEVEEKSVKGILNFLKSEVQRRII